MKRERPPMPPLSVRVQVAERQLGFPPDDMGLSKKDVLDILLSTLKARLRAEHLALDHDPALILRAYNPRIKDVAARYTPHAHDPTALIYREKADHQQKTTGRRPGASRTITTKGSDIGLKAKFARLEKPRKRPKRKISSRGFQKGVNRQLTSRPFRA
jgi:hypothetical protein